jgi:hypothetical protein
MSIFNSVMEEEKTEEEAFAIANSQCQAVPSKFRKVFNSLTKSLQKVWYDVFCKTNDTDKAFETVNTVQKMYKEHKIFGQFVKSSSEDNSYIIAGIATTEAIDTDNEIVDKSTVIEFLKDFFSKGAPLCNRHVRDDVVGKVLTANYLIGDELVEFCTKNNVPIPTKKSGLCVTAEVEKESIKEEIDKGILSTFSVGLTCFQKIGKRLLAKIHELSVVPFPANIECNFNIAKMMKVTGEPDEKDIGENKSEIKPELSTKDAEKKQKTNIKSKIIRRNIMDFTQEEVKIV